MITQICRGRHVRVRMVMILWCLSYSFSAHAWQQEYIADDAQSDSPDRYTWDSDHQPRYEDILAERIRSQERAQTSLDFGWQLPVLRDIHTGPVAGWRWDGGSTAMYTGYGDSVIRAGASEMQWHAPVSTLGWRIDSALGPVRPWAQISYNQQFGANASTVSLGLHPATASAQYGNWVDVSVGADMPITKHLAAWASLSQSDGMANNGEMYIYNMGVSAKF